MKKDLKNLNQFLTTLTVATLTPPLPRSSSGTHMSMVRFFFPHLQMKRCVMANGYGQARGFLGDFKDFIMKGNVLDLAVAVVIGAAFGKIITSLLDDVITPALLKPAMDAANVKDLAGLVYGTVKYGNFLAAVLNFIIIAFVIFVLIKSVEGAKRKMQRQEALADPAADPAVVAQENLINSLDRLTRAVESQTR
jgi:large conductance mechanosensitive channel